MAHYVVVGGGIVGLATALRLTEEHPHSTVTVLEKEDRVAAHQSGHNSGVIHTGIYHHPGSLKATLGRAGAASMVEFCQAHDIPYRVTGKLIVATSPEELPRLHALHERAWANHVPARLIGPGEAREIEPAVTTVGALHVAGTGIVDYGQVSRVMADLITRNGGKIRLGSRVTGLHPDGSSAAVVVNTTIGAFRADYLVNCAGLHADRVARMAGLRPPARIVPFRGEYYELSSRELVRGLIYPVPDPTLPFLGVHLTRMIDGTVHAGPNAVLALAREGYWWGRVRPRDILSEASYAGLWRLAARHWPAGLMEVLRSLSRRRFAASLARLVPAVTETDIEPAGAGVRAQAIAPDGGLVDDFLIMRARRQVHVLNAPSPAATSSLEIARRITAALHAPSRPASLSRRQPSPLARAD